MAVDTGPGGAALRHRAAIPRTRAVPYARAGQPGPRVAPHPL
ncbi:hypothetical protein [Streptomyces sp. Root1310]|nr:hypothetical protein [Streptomyces sp. Root1310]